MRLASAYVSIIRTQTLTSTHATLEPHSTLHQQQRQPPGSSKGGDCDRLLLASSPGLDGIINLRAHGGDMLLDGTHVESWDMTAGTNDEDIEDGRRCVPA